MTTTLQPINASGSPEVQTNENFVAVAPAGAFSKDATTTSGLTFGYLGGTLVIDGVLTEIADGTVALTDASTNYIERTRAGVVSKNTTGFTAGQVPLFTAVTSGGVVTTLTDHRTTNPKYTGVLSKSVAGSSDVTLTAAEASNDILILTGALAGNISVIVPTVKQARIVHNNTSGAYSLTVKTAAGTGIAVTQGGKGLLYCDGTDVQTVSPSSGGAGTTASRIAAQGLGAPFILGRSGIPFIGLSSGSVAADGTISGITALPKAYASAYCWFPANALAASIAAGWYYCEFSSTTAGTAYLDTYVSGAVSIPASPTAVTDGRGAFTGDTGEEFGPTITVPANSMGPNGLLRITTLQSANNSANAKTWRVRFSGNSGTVFGSLGEVSVILETTETIILNRGVANSQIGQSIRAVGAGAGLNSGGTTASVDTTSDTTLVISIQRVAATDNFVLENFLIILVSDGN